MENFKYLVISSSGEKSLDLKGNIVNFSNTYSFENFGEAMRAAIIANNSLGTYTFKVYIFEFNF